MNAQIDQLAQALQITLAVFTLVVLVMTVYLLWLVIELHKQVCRYCLRMPQIERDRDGRRIKERV